MTVTSSISNTHFWPLSFLNLSVSHWLSLLQYQTLTFGHCHFSTCQCHIGCHFFNIRHSLLATVISEPVSVSLTITSSISNTYFWPLPFFNLSVSHWLSLLQYQTLTSGHCHSWTCQCLIDCHFFNIKHSLLATIISEHVSVSLTVTSSISNTHFWPLSFLNLSVSHWLSLLQYHSPHEKAKMSKITEALD